MPCRPGLSKNKHLALENTEYPKLSELKGQLKRTQDARSVKINNEISALRKKTDGQKAELKKLDARKADIEKELTKPR